MGYRSHARSFVSFDDPSLSSPSARYEHSRRLVAIGSPRTLIYAPVAACFVEGSFHGSLESLTIDPCEGGYLCSQPSSGKIRFKNIPKDTLYDGCSMDTQVLDSKPETSIELEHISNGTCHKAPCVAAHMNLRR